MVLPSFPLQSTLVFSNPRWGTQVQLYLCVSWVVLGFCALVRELGKNSGYGE